MQFGTVPVGSTISSPVLCVGHSSWPSRENINEWPEKETGSTMNPVTSASNAEDRQLGKSQ